MQYQPCHTYTQDIRPSFGLLFRVIQRCQPHLVTWTIIVHTKGVILTFCVYASTLCWVIICLILYNIQRLMHMELVAQIYINLKVLQIHHNWVACLILKKRFLSSLCYDLFLLGSNFHQPFMLTGSSIAWKNYAPQVLLCGSFDRTVFTVTKLHSYVTLLPCHMFVS